MNAGDDTSLLPGFHWFGINDAAWYEELRRASGTTISDNCTNSRIAWNGGFSYQCAELEGCAVLVSDGGVYTHPHIVQPIGRLTVRKLQAILEQLEPLFAERDWPLNMMYVDAKRLPMLEQVPGFSVEISHNRDFSDYLYDAEKLRHLSGKALHSRKNHVNQFFRAYPQFQFTPITAADADQAIQLVQNWCIERELDCSSYLESDLPPICALFRAFDRLDVRGGAIRIDGRLVAFTLGTLLDDQTAVIHFEKADYAYNGLYAAINKLTLEFVFADVKWVNREEDLGIPGLRQAKESYVPIRLIDKHAALWRRNSRC